jgi:hypothetical protein
MDLVTIDAQLLVEVSVAVKKTNAEQVYVGVGCFLKVITGKNAEAATVKLK